MIRVWLEKGGPVELLNERQFVARVTELQRDSEGSTAEGAVLVEGVDREGRVLWRGRYSSLARLSGLAEFIRRHLPDEDWPADGDGQHGKQ